MTDSSYFEELEDMAGQDISEHLALERTRMASERTLFSLIRTGFAIAGGGVLITRILSGNKWGEWLTALFSLIFVMVGFTLVLIALHRYRQVESKIKEHGGITPISSRLIMVLIFVLQVALAAVIIVYILE